MIECPVVETKLGKIKGKTVNNVEGGKDVFRYSSVPFAKPPVGELRFEPPVEPDQWNGVMDGTCHSPSPLQDMSYIDKLTKYWPPLVADLSKETSEDCLYMSIYTTSTSKTANLPVLFWIYGGGFVIGGESFYDGSVLAGLHDVVVVVPNYRVGMYGFLSLGPDSGYPGNVGLLDQIRALKWTREHIKNFGGNPDNITIFGESAGGMSVNYHVLSPMSKGLFAKAISHSGSFYMKGFPSENGDVPLAALLNDLHIVEDENDQYMEQLKLLPIADLNKALNTLSKSYINFGPVIDGKFFPKNASELAKENVNSVPYIIGCNNTEGYGMLTLEAPPGFANGITKEACFDTLKGFLGAFYTGLPDSAYDAMAERYSKGKKDDEFKWSKVYGEIFGDIMFVNPAIKSVKHHIENNNPTYMYVMKQALKFNHDLAYGPDHAMKAPFCECDHGDDVTFTLGLPFHKGKFAFDVEFSNDEKSLSAEWMKYICNFAKNGDPNTGVPVKTKWPKYNEKEQNYLSVQEPCSAGEKYGVEMLKFLEEVIEPMRK